ncbi:MAG: PHP domain-containing protein [Clostridia bacterium]|nr:PHP domain-containing protein [Clostridia bacterium]
MSGYRYQMHCHTAPCSRCGHMSPAELTQGLLAAGYQGCVITNHFYYGNTGVDRAMPWAAFVRPYAEDYAQICACAAPYDLDILFGVEEGVGGGREILCYGLSPALIAAHPELRLCSAAQWHALAREAGGLILQAHPFRSRDYIELPGVLPPEEIDGIEVFNFGNSDRDNAEAAACAAGHPEWITISGADAHTAEAVGLGGIETDRRIQTNEDLVEVLRSGRYRML